MRYITEIDAVEEFETLCVGDGVLLTGGDGLMRMEEQRLLIQSLLVSPPQSMADLRLNRLLSSQTVLWSEKFENCAHEKLIVRLPDQPIDVILPDTPAEQERLAEVMARDTKWVEEQVKALKNMNPGLSCRGCRMMIGNELLCKIFLQSSMTAAKQQGYEDWLTTVQEDAANE